MANEINLTLSNQTQSASIFDRIFAEHVWHIFPASTFSNAEEESGQLAYGWDQFIPSDPRTREVQSIRRFLMYEVQEGSSVRGIIYAGP